MLSNLHCNVTYDYHGRNRLLDYNLGNSEKRSFPQIRRNFVPSCGHWVPAATSDVIIVCEFFKTKFPGTYRAQFEIEYFFGKKFLARRWSCQNSRESFDKELGASVLLKKKRTIADALMILGVTKYRVTQKKTVITKFRITSEFIFRSSPNFGHLRSHLCSIHPPSFKSSLRILLVQCVFYWRSTMCSRWAPRRCRA